MKFIKLLLIIITLLFSVRSELLEKFRKSRKHHLHKKKPDLDKNLKDQIQTILQTPVQYPEDLPDLPIYNDCWVKYFHYRNNFDSIKPKSLFKNELYFHQYNNGTLLKEKLEMKDNVIIPII